MTNKKRQLNIISFFTLIFFVSIGTLLIYRAKLPESGLTQIKAKLLKLDLIDGIGKRGRNYAVVLTIEEGNKKYGVYAGTKSQAQTALNSFDLSVNQEYTFYIDPSVSDIDDINLGLRIVKDGNQTVFEENMKDHLGFGMIAIGLGIIGSLTVYFFGHRKLKNERLANIQ